MTPGGTARSIDRELRALRRRDAPSVRAVRRKWSRELRGAPPKHVLDTAFALLERHGQHFVAMELVRFHAGALASVRTPQLRRLGAGIDGWAAVDTFGCLVAGHVWRERQVPDSEIHRWARSRDLWWRRAALVATVPLNLKSHGGAGDAGRTLAVCRLLVDDREDMVIKALSWSLRVLSERDARVVRAFVERHGDALAARVRREVGNKLRTGLKNPRP